MSRLVLFCVVLSCLVLSCLSYCLVTAMYHCIALYIFLSSFFLSLSLSQETDFKDDLDEYDPSSVEISKEEVRFALTDGNGFCLVMPWSRLIALWLTRGCLVIILFLSFEPCVILSCLILSYLVLSCLVLPCLVLSCLVLSCLALSYLVLSCLVLSCLVLSCLFLSYLVMSCLVLSYLVLSCQ